MGHLSISGHETLGPSHCMHTLNVTQQILPQTAFQNVKGSILACKQGVTAPITPINPYLGQNAQKINHLVEAKLYSTFTKP